MADPKKTLPPQEPIDREPSPKDLALFEWLEKLFWVDAQSPERIDVRIVSGKFHEKLGHPLLRRDYGATKEAKPPKPKLVALANEIGFAIQRDCDIQRKSLVYAIFAWDFSRGDEPYERYLMRKQPGTMFQNDGSPRADGGGDDDESGEKRFAVQLMKHDEAKFQLGIEERRTNAEIVMGLLDRMDRIVERADARIKEQDETIRKQNEMMERALSIEDERISKREWMKLKVEGAKKMLDLGVGLAPSLINQLAGKSVVESKETGESITLKEFFKTVDKGGKLTQEQSNKAFGSYNEKGELLTAGALSLHQAKLLYDVAKCDVPPDELDKLMPDGPLAISQEQIIKLQQIFPLDQILPVGAIIEARFNKWQEKQRKMTGQ